MSRKHRFDGDETVNLLENFEKDTACCNSASDDETNNDFEESGLDGSKESDSDDGIGDDEESYTKFTGKDEYQWKKIEKSN